MTISTIVKELEEFKKLSSVYIILFVVMDYIIDKEINLPDIANPLNPTARTRKEMATPLLWEYPTTKRRVASIPKP